MKWKRKCSLALVMLLFTVFMVSERALGQQYLIDFEDLSDGYVFTATTQGYDNLDAALGHGITITGAGHPTVVSGTSGHTPYNTLINEAGTEFGWSAGENFEISLNNFTSHYVRLFAGLRNRDECRVTAHLRAFDRGGHQLLHDTVNLGYGPTDAVHELLVESEEGAIARLVISYGFDEDSTCDVMNGLGPDDAWQPEMIDSLLIRVWDGDEPVLPDDTTPPVVHIRTPSEGETVDHGCVIGYVEEEGNINRIEVQSESADGRSSDRIDGIVYTTLYDEDPPHHYFSADELSLTSGGNTITVTATDSAGNTGSDTVEVVFEPHVYPPPPPEWPANLDFRASGMEVTQVIQNWDMIDGNILAGTHMASLVAGKKTLVRIYAEVLGSEGMDIPGVRCALHVYDASGSEFSGSPIYAMNSPTLVPGETHLDQRLVSDKSFNFILPPEWTAVGGVSLEAIINPWNGIPEIHYDWQNNEYKTVTFRDTDPLTINVYPIRSTGLDFDTGVVNDYSPTWNECLDNIARLRQIYPVSPERLTVNLVQRVQTEEIVDTDHGGDQWDLYRLLGDFRRYLGFYYVITSPSTPFRGSKTVYLGLTDNVVTHRGVTAWRRAVSLSVANDSMFYGLKTAHEIGHCEGLGHVQGCDDPAGPYESYPIYRDPDGTRFPEQSIGDWGVDIQDDNTLVLKDPATQGDLMSYCGSDRWMSLYTWDWLYDHFRVSSSRSARASSAKAISSDLITSDLIKIPVPYFYIGGTIKPDGSGALDPVLVKDHPDGYSDHTGSGKYLIQLQDKGGNSLFDRRFDPDPLTDLESYAIFFEVLPLISGTRTIRLSGGDLPAPVSVTAGSSTPKVTVTAPNGGGDYPAVGTMKVSWNGSDADGDSLSYTLFYSSDNGVNWRVIAAGITVNYVNARLDDLPGGTDSCLIRVLASDGINQGEDRSDDFFTKTGQPPLVGIISPNQATVFDYGEPIVFESIVSDREDEAIPDADIVWESDRAGVLGRGEVISVFNRSISAIDMPLTHVPVRYSLSPGLHLITLTVTDSDGMTSSDMVPIHIRSNGTSGNVGTGPMVDIKANGADGQIDVSPSDPVDIKLSLDPNGYNGDPLEWWFYIDSTYGDICWVYPVGWQLGRSELGLFPPFAFSNLSMWNSPLPAGTYNFYFSLDSTIDGMPGGEWSDFVQVNVRACDAGLTNCGGECVELSTSSEHCGNCRNFCREGYICQGGQCVEEDPCEDGLTNCDGSCTDLSIDSFNCGRCGTVCPAGHLCKEGQCIKIFACEEGLTECDGECVDLSSDAFNCGECGYLCSESYVCKDGICVSVFDCDEGLTECNGDCVDLSNDLSNCGECYHDCPKGTVCKNGDCVNICDKGLTYCNGDCVDLSNDLSNCGACYHDCPEGTVCKNGDCVNICDKGLTYCNGDCVDLSNDLSNCGECYHDCPKGYDCKDGTCVRYPPYVPKSS